MHRDTTLERVKDNRLGYDVVVIGGGASGLGAAVDAALRGHKTLLIEQLDFAKGTSSRSTKLVHGGVRYLRQGNISLVLEALKERGLLYRNAPHLVNNMSFVIPNYKWWEGPFYGIGMKVYDGLAGKLGLSPSRHLSREETIEMIPTVEQKDLTGGVIYHDGQFDDSRLAVNLAQTAVNLGAEVLNYVKCVGLLKEKGFVRGIRCRDEETGDEFEVRAKSVINATGVYVDGIRSMDDTEAKPVVAVSQGVHIVLPKEFLPGEAAIMVPKTSDGRVLFCVPWHECVIVGTTDTPLAAKSIEPRALAEERDFIMTEAAKYLAKDPRPEDVLSIFAGLRPLVKSGEGGDTAALSRDHTIIVAESGLITLTGGKWTTYRRMAEDVIDHAEMVGNLDQRPSESKRLQIHGWRREKVEDAGLQVYGADSDDILNLMTQDSSLAELIHPLLPYRKAEVVWHVRSEMARTVEDVLSRRTRALLLNARASMEAATVVAEILAGELGHDEDWEKASVSSYQELARGYDFMDAASIGRK